MTQPSAALIAAIADSPPTQSQATLEKLRDDIRKMRNLELEIEVKTEALKQLSSELFELKTKTVPDKFSELNMLAFTLDAEGNQPAYEAKLGTMITASIPDEKKMEAFKWLEKHKYGDLIKNAFVVSFGMGDNKAAKKLAAFLKKSKMDYDAKASVHSSTLKAFVREQIEKGKAVPLDLFGAFIQKTVNIKPIKEKRI